ncbi:MAG: hypothetical protein JW746_00470 [Candidatus Krumholzibacteriota bacterium]|nr:hypothetical protein [Candidatus Krumholzibacteriota bacterium]
MKFKSAAIFTAFVCVLSILPSCSGERENKDLYLLEEYESASGISDPEKRVERLGLYIDAHNSHPYRILAYVKIIETIASDLNDLDRAMKLFEEYLSKETDPSARGELLYRKFAYLWNSDRDKAVDFAEKLIEGGEKDYKLFLYLGYYLADLEGKSELVVRTLEKALGNTEDRSKKNHILSVLAGYYETEKRDKDAYETALLASEYPFANQVIGRYLWENGEREESLRAYIRLVAGAPGYGHYVKLDSLYSLVYPGKDDLEDKIIEQRLSDEGPLPEMEFTDLEGKIYKLSRFRGTKLVITAWSPT